MTTEIWFPVNKTWIANMFMGVGLTIIVGLLSNFNPRPLGAAPQLLVIASVRVESDP